MTEKNDISPTFCCFTLTEECLLSCKMCRKWEQDIFIRPGQRQAGLADWKKCALSLKEFASDDLTINLGGGEVTLVPWLFELVRFCHELGFKTNIATNGFLMDAAMAEAVNRSGLDFVNISLDSLDEETHDRLRGRKGVFRQALKAVDLLHEYAPRTKIGICSVIMRPTIEGMPGLVQWAQENEKIDMVSLMVLMQPNNTLPMEKWWMSGQFAELWPQDMQIADSVLDRLIALKQSGYKLCNAPRHLAAFKAYLRDPDTYVKESTCNIERAVHVTSVGDMFMCFRQESLGRIWDASLREMWESVKASAIREKIRQCRENCHFLLNCKFEA